MSGSVFDKSPVAVLTDQMFLLPNDTQSIATTEPKDPDSPFGLSSAEPASTPATRGSRGKNFSGLTKLEGSICGLRSNFGKQRTFDNSYTHPLRKETALKRMLLNIALAAVAASVWPLVTPAQIGSEKSIVRHLGMVKNSRSAWTLCSSTARLCLAPRGPCRKSQATD